MLSSIPPQPDAWIPILQYDVKGFGAARTNFLGAWLSLYGGVVSHHGETGAVNGYGVIREADIGYRVGPLFADNADIAHEVLQGLLARVPAGSRVFIDVPEMADALPVKAGLTLVRDPTLSPPVVVIGL